MYGRLMGAATMSSYSPEWGPAYSRSLQRAVEATTR